jgi:hypothetical protein
VSGNGPLIIGGASRSGKTLMRWMCVSHSRIAVSRRTDMWPRYYRRFGDLGTRDNYDRCVQAMLRRPQIAALDVDTDALRRDFEGGPATYARLFALVHEQYARREGKARWGDQTGFVERFADELMRAYVAARVVHMVRDPRDRYAAILARGYRHPFPRWRATSNWLASARLAVRNRRRYPNAYMVVRYESLVARPEATMRDVCAFLEEEFEPEMLAMPGARRYDADRGRSVDGSPICRDHVGCYRGALSARDVAFIERTAQRSMREFGYVPRGSALPAIDRLRLATTVWPARAAIARVPWVVAE